MRLTILFCSVFTIAVFDGAPKAWAENGLNYTTLGASNIEAPAPKLINLKTIQPVTPISQESLKADSPMADVWEKYKKLATGQTEKQPKQTTIQKPVKPEIEKPKLAQPPQQKTGFSGVLSKAQENKQLRGQMQSVTVTKSN